MLLNRSVLAVLKLLAPAGAFCLLCACASSAGTEGNCAQRFRLSAEGKSLERCMSSGGVAVFQGEDGTFVDCKFPPAAEKPRKAPGRVLSVVKP